MSSAVPVVEKNASCDTGAGIEQMFGQVESHVASIDGCIQAGTYSTWGLPEV